MTEDKLATKLDLNHRPGESDALCKSTCFPFFFRNETFVYCFRLLFLDSITKRIKQLEDLITDNNATNLLKHVALLTTTIATSSALTAATTSITNQLEANNSGKIVSIETLLDALVILFDECSNSSLRREKTVSDFLELRKLTRDRHPLNISRSHFSF